MFVRANLVSFVRWSVEIHFDGRGETIDVDAKLSQLLSGLTLLPNSSEQEMFRTYE